MSNIGDLVNLAYAAAVRQIYPDAIINFSGEKLEEGIARLSTGKLVDASLALRSQGKWRLAYGVLDEIVENRNVYGDEPYAGILSYLCHEYGTQLINPKGPFKEDWFSEFRGIAALEITVRLDPSNADARLKLLKKYAAHHADDDFNEMADGGIAIAFRMKDTGSIRAIQQARCDRGSA